jgi:branched-chain amino acid transport system ATP-binding protein
VTDPLLSLSGVDAHYGRAHILHQVSLEVCSGTVVALLGRNGAGKSTTLKTVIGLTPATTGAITFKGQEIQSLPSYAISRLGVGYVPEERRIFTELTVLENLDVGRQPTRPGAPVWTPERLFELFPNLGEMRDRPGGRMSGGEQQMLTIARTLMGNPTLILLDEPSEGISPKIVEQMALTIRRLKSEGLTVLLSEQNLHFAALVSDQAVVIEKGAVRWTGAMADLMADKRTREAYLTV